MKNPDRIKKENLQKEFCRYRIKLMLMCIVLFIFLCLFVYSIAIINIFRSNFLFLLSVFTIFIVNSRIFLLIGSIIYNLSEKIDTLKNSIQEFKKID